MIRLTRLNNTEFVLNADLIRWIETCPDTLITLINHECLMVQESLDEVVTRIMTYQQAKHLLPRQQFAPCDLGPMGPNRDYL